MPRRHMPLLSRYDISLASAPLHARLAATLGMQRGRYTCVSLLFHRSMFHFVSSRRLARLRGFLPPGRILTLRDAVTLALVELLLQAILLSHRRNLAATCGDDIKMTEH